MRKAVWTSFGIALILVNLIAEVGEYYTGIHVHMFLRIALIFRCNYGCFGSRWGYHVGIQDGSGSTSLRSC